MSTTSARTGLSKAQLITILVSGVIVTVSQFVYAQVGIHPHLFDTNQATTTRVNGDYIAFELRAPDTAIKEESSRTEAGCTSVQYIMDNHRLVVNAYSRDCDLPGTPQRVINGHHGMYRTLDNVSEPIDLEKIDTPLGDAEIFLQEYSEHTNFSREWKEPVAIITFDKPTNADFPTMVITSQKAALSRTEFTQIVSALRPPLH